MRDLGDVKCIKGDEGKVLVKESKIRKRWWSYFSNRFSGEKTYYSLCVQNGEEKGHQNYRLCSRMSKEEARDALRKMKPERAVSPDLIPMEI